MAGLCWFQTIAGRCPDSALRGRSVLRSDHNHHVVRAQYGQPRRTEVSRGKWQACVGFKRLPEGVLTLRFEAGQYIYVERADDVQNALNNALLNVTRFREWLTYEDANWRCFIHRSEEHTSELHS